MKKQSAGLLIYRQKNGRLEVLIAHMGGPFHSKKDKHTWTIPKGLYKEDEEPLAAAKREFNEEIGQTPPESTPLELGEIKRSDGKYIKIWALKGDIDVTEVKSNTFDLEWPPKSGKIKKFPEIDKADWFDLEQAAIKLQPAQTVFLDRLAQKLGVGYKVAEHEQQKELL